MHPERRHHLLDALSQGLDEIGERVRVARGDRVLEEQIGIHRVGTQCERDHQVVEVAQASRREDDRAVAAERGLRDQCTVRGRDDQQRIEPRAALAKHTIVTNEDEPRAGANRAGRLRAEPRERVEGMLFPVSVGLEDHRRGDAVVRETRDHVLEEPGALRARQPAEVIAADAGLRAVPAEEDRRR